MLRQLQFFLLFLLGAMILGSLLTMMVAFTGGGTAGSDLAGLLLVQVAVTPLALALVAKEVSAFVKPNGWRQGLVLLWHKIPAWLVLALVLLNSLVLIGELSVVLLAYLMNSPVAWTEHIPLFSLLACSAAFAIQYGKVAQLYGKGITPIGRWP